ncbi:MAG: F0F1 ATP synthase subunit A [Dehalococcoidia bacterium]|nr:F0F1 ATP synthase subunit A [Dehalococcoidia bacterium]
MKLVLILVGVLAVGGWLALGLVIAQGPQPEIIVPAEIITKVGFLNISNTMITAWTVMAILIILSFLATRSMKLMPSGLQNFAEGVVGFLVGQCEEIAGEKNGRRFFSVVATIFLFIIVSNWFGLMPFFNAIGKTEDVGHHIFHEIEHYHGDGHLMGCESEVDPADAVALAECEELHFVGWKMDDAAGMVVAKPRAKDAEFEVHPGEEPSVTLDRYIVFLANEFADFEEPHAEGEAVDGHAAEEAPSAETVEAALAALNEGDKTPKVLLAEAESHGEGEEEAHGVASHALGEEVTVSGVSFEDSQKLGLVIPFFRSTFSDVNNTLAMGIVAFLCIEFWGFQALGFGYLKKFFNLNGVNSFVGILELLSEFIRIISFAFRLFGNIFAGEVLILMLTFLMPFLFVDVIYGLELFVGFIQASVFALLTLVFAVGAVEHHGEEEHHDGHHGEDAAADPHHHSGAVQAH